MRARMQWLGAAAVLFALGAGCSDESEPGARVQSDPGGQPDAGETTGGEPDVAPDGSGDDADFTDTTTAEEVADASPDGGDPGNEDAAPPDKCCATSEDCGGVDVCVHDPAAPEGEPGVCLPDVLLSSVASACWTDADCPGGETCAGAVIVGCEAPDALVPKWGHCIIQKCCASDAECEDGWRCEEKIGGYVPIPPAGDCWTGEDCDSNKSCVGGYLCPCWSEQGHACADCRIGCGGPDETGTCIDLEAAGCCKDVSDCPEPDAGESVVCTGKGGDAAPGFGVCASADTKKGYCWDDTQCGPGQMCHGASACGCLMDCMDEWPGVCVAASGACKAVKEEWVEEICDAASVVIFDGEKCKATCPGCCGCKPFCDLTFGSIDACQKACGIVPAKCAVFDGTCDDALPAEPWWFFDGKSCVMEDSCVCEGCPGTFDTKEQCLACLPDECGGYVGALMDCPYQLDAPDGAGCPFAKCMDAPCAADADCPAAGSMGAAAKCVTGSCVWCWSDDQCDLGELCRAGRCVKPAADCPPPPKCSAVGCKLVSPSEHACPVCVCDSIHGVPCATDVSCLLLSSHPYMHCVYGRCAECRTDDECGWGTCLPPGVCFGMSPSPHLLFGTWLIGWAGGMDHFSYFRFEPDGTLRRGSYEPAGSFSDDIPPLPCWPSVWPPPSPLLGTWEPEITASGFLIVDMALNVSCDDGEGWGARFRITISDDGKTATFDDTDSDLSYMAQRVPAGSCSPDFGACEAPAL